MTGLLKSMDGRGRVLAAACALATLLTIAPALAGGGGGEGGGHYTDSNESR